MSRIRALWTSFLASYEVQFIRQHAVLLTVCGAVLAVVVMFFVAAR